ncbi:MAG: RNA pseudouridine synthase [Erysipelotrichales bacterium]|nr:RNA pseudouridine synthase [Erysipelotrichales bacterium]
MLNIIFEDNHLIVCLKPAGILSQKDYTGQDSMVELVKDYLRVKYQKPGNIYLGLVHRLDRNTEGLMVFAKTSKAAARLSKDIQKHDFNKNYYALVCGKLKDSGILVNNLSKDEAQNKSFVSNQGKEAVLEYKVIEKVKDISLVDVNLITGRHHQIRVQFSYIGCPLYGDVKYGAKSLNKDFLALYAYDLRFFHPVTKAEMRFSVVPKGKIWDNFFKLTTK